MFHVDLRPLFESITPGRSDDPFIMPDHDTAPYESDDSEKSINSLRPSELAERLSDISKYLMKNKITGKEKPVLMIDMDLSNVSLPQTNRGVNFLIPSFYRQLHKLAPDLRIIRPEIEPEPDPYSSERDIQKDLLNYETTIEIPESTGTHWASVFPKMAEIQAVLQEYNLSIPENLRKHLVVNFQRWDMAEKSDSPTALTEERHCQSCVSTVQSHWQTRYP